MKPEPPSKDPPFDPEVLCFTVMEDSPFAIAAVDEASHTVRYANPAFIRLVAPTGGGAVGRPICELLPDERECIDLLHQVFRTRLPAGYTDTGGAEGMRPIRTYTMWPIPADGRLVGVLIQGAEIGGAGTKIVEMNQALVLGAVRQHEMRAAADESNARLQEEIAVRKRIEAELQAAHSLLSRHAEDLEAQVAERTAALMETNKDLEASSEASLKAKEEYRKLLVKSERMQGDLRKLTRQFLTAQEAERRAISRELHDDILQTLFGINVELAALVNLPFNRDAIEKAVERVQGCVDRSLASIHQFAKDLRPAVLDDLGLKPALTSYLKDFTTRTGIQVDFSTDPAVEALGTAERTSLFRVAQEALTNVERHARTRAASVSLESAGRFILMEITDHGQGFNASGRNTSRLGLLGMKERVEMIGGTLDIKSVQGEYTRVRVTIPGARPPRKSRARLKPPSSDS